jgi:tetratricopeptide (TPR) repeat protein
MKKICFLIIYLWSFLVNAQSIELLLQKSQKAIESNQLKEAIEFANQALSLDSNVADAYLKRGLARYAFSEYDAAIADYSKAIKLQNNLKDAYYNRGVAYYWLSKNDLAQKDFEKALQIDAKDARTHTALGVLYAKLGETEHKKYFALAEKSYKKAIESNPEYASAYYNLALLESEKAPKKALELLDRYTSLKKDADGFLLKGIVQNNLKQYEKALQDLAEAEKLRSYDHQIYIEKAWAFLQMRQNSEACKNWKKAEELGSVEASNWLEKYCK